LKRDIIAKGLQNKIILDDGPQPFYTSTFTNRY
jgi:hypothetical protein